MPKQPALHAETPKVVCRKPFLGALASCCTRTKFVSCRSANSVIWNSYNLYRIPWFHTAWFDQSGSTLFVFPNCNGKPPARSCKKYISRHTGFNYITNSLRKESTQLHYPSSRKKPKKLDDGCRRHDDIWNPRWTRQSIFYEFGRIENSSTLSTNFKTNKLQY